MNIVRFGGKIFTSIQRKCGSVRFYTNYPQKEVSHENWILFPREREGNVYSDNWSLVEHGVTPVGSAFKNGRLTFLLSKLPSKVVEGTVEVPTLKYSGVTQIVEAGDSISHEAFSEILLKTQKFFSSGIDLYFEDSAVVATHGARVGVRILSNNPAVSLVARSFMVTFARLLIIMLLVSFYHSS